MQATLEERLAALEAEVAMLKRLQRIDGEAKEPWWEQRWGAFKDDPMYEEAMRLGTAYRKSQPTPMDDNVPS